MLPLPAAGCKFQSFNDVGSLPAHHPQTPPPPTTIRSVSPRFFKPGAAPRTTPRPKSLRQSPTFSHLSRPINPQTNIQILASQFARLDRTSHSASRAFTRQRRRHGIRCPTMFRRTERSSCQATAATARNRNKSRRLTAGRSVVSPKTRLARPGDSTRQTNAAGFQFDRSAATATDVATKETAAKNAQP